VVPGLGPRVPERTHGGFFAGPSWLVGTALALATNLLAVPAFAQAVPVGAPPPATPETSPATLPAVSEARAAFLEGIELGKQERWVEALQAFERSDALHPHAITTYNIGYCERLLGHSTRAHKMFSKVLTDHRARGEVELPVELVAAAQTYLSEAERQIARVVVTIAPANGAVAVDRGPLELVAAEGPRPVLLAGTRAIGPPEVPPSFTFEVRLDPGTHVFVLSTRDRADVVASETLAPGVQISLDLRVPALPETTEASKLPVRAAGAETMAERPNRLPAFLVFGIAAAALTVGTVGGLIAFAKKTPLDQACHGADTSSCDGERQSANRAADISTVAFIASGLAAGVGTVIFFTAPVAKGSHARYVDDASRPRASSSVVSGWIGWGTLGMGGRF
jgi:hypothetical protein